MRVEAVMGDDALVVVKTIIGSIGGFLLSQAFQLEPSAGVWVAAFSGSFLAASLSSDKKLVQFMTHLGIGIIFGLFIAQMIEWVWKTPRIPVAALSASLGYALHSYLTATIAGGKLFEAIGQAIAALTGRGGGSK